MSKYTKLLSDDEIENFFYDNGYELVKNLTDDDGKPINAIERSEDNIFIRAKKTSDLDSEFIKSITQKSPELMALSTLASSRSAYGRNIDLIYFSDYYMSKFCITEDDTVDSQKLCTNYIKFMVQRFPTFKADFINYCDSLKEDELGD